MKSIQIIQSQHTSIPILADDITEFHAARLLLLIKICGAKNHIQGLTKMAKLDFFVRYPQFFEVICDALDKDISPAYHTVESSMIRYHYGPWDQRYYDVLGFLSSRNLIGVTRQGNTFNLTLTEDGIRVAGALEANGAFSELIEQMRLVKKVLGSRSGTQLKQLIYSVFRDEVSQLELGEVIEP